MCKKECIMYTMASSSSSEHKLWNTQQSSYRWLAKRKSSIANGPKIIKMVQLSLSKVEKKDSWICLQHQMSPMEMLFQRMVFINDKVKDLRKFKRTTIFNELHCLVMNDRIPFHQKAWVKCDRYKRVVYRGILLFLEGSRTTIFILSTKHLVSVRWNTILQAHYLQRVVQNSFWKAYLE